MRVTRLPAFDLIKLLICINIVYFSALPILPMNADESPLSCVENQITSLKLDTDIAGLFNDLNISVGENLEPRHLSDRQNYILCRQLGLLRESAKAHWPSKLARYSIVHPLDMPTEIISILEEHTENAFIELSDRYQVELTYPIKIVVGRRKQEIWENFQMAFPKSHLKSQFEESYEFTCQDGFIGGFSVYNVITLCPLEDDIEYDPNEILARGKSNQKATMLQRTFFHEFFHTVQSELLGNSEYCNISSQSCANNVPLWFVEGTAEFFAENTAYRKYKYHINLSLSEADLTSSDLKKFETTAFFSKYPYDVYDLGRAATFSLMIKNKPNDIIGFLAEVGKGALWQQSFNRAFGLSVENFYKDFSASEL